MNLSRPDRPSRLSALAAAYVLGTLPGRARARLTRIARTDTVVAQAIRGWEQRLAPLAEAAPPITPSPQVWRRVALRLGLNAVRCSERGAWWARTGFWRGLAIASLAAALVLAVGLLRVRQEPGAPIVVVLAGQDAKPALIATVARNSREMMVKVVGAKAVPPDKSLELWLLPQGAAPRSLGLVPALGMATLELPALPDVALANVSALAVSLEPAGGSPTGRLQGPLLYSGPVEKFY